MFYLQCGVSVAWRIRVQRYCVGKVHIESVSPRIDSEQRTRRYAKITWKKCPEMAQVTIWLKATNHERINVALGNRKKVHARKGVEVALSRNGADVGMQIQHIRRSLA